jgi:hypothetical protein
MAIGPIPSSPAAHRYMTHWHSAAQAAHGHASPVGKAARRCCSADSGGVPVAAHQRSLGFVTLSMRRQRGWQLTEDGADGGSSRVDDGGGRLG